MAQGVPEARLVRALARAPQTEAVEAMTMYVKCTACRGEGKDSSGHMCSRCAGAKVEPYGAEPYNPSPGMMPGRPTPKDPWVEDTKHWPDDANVDLGRNLPAPAPNCSRCRDTGYVVNGFGHVVCPLCHGNRQPRKAFTYARCPTCNGEGRIPDIWGPDPEQVRECDTCLGDCSVLV
jgi:hypothetical protein